MKAGSVSRWIGGARLLLIAAGLVSSTMVCWADVNCDLSAYKATAGLTAHSDAGALEVSWAGDNGQEVRLRLAVNGGTPVIQELSVRDVGGAWVSLGHNIAPVFDVVSGLRRISEQQLEPIRALNIPVDQKALEQFRWDPFWDAPLHVAPLPKGNGGAGSPVAGIPGTDQPGLPRKPEEINRSSASYHVTSCDLKSDGARLTIDYPGVTLGVFEGKLRFTIFKGTNLIRQEIVATTNHPWVAYKYDAGLKGLAIGAGSKAAWRDTASDWQANDLGGRVNADKVALAARNRLIFADLAGGSIAAFPPPHKFFWSREVAVNMGYNWYRKDSGTSYSIGIRQNESEDPSQNAENWALYSARPGTTQVMTVYLYPSSAPAAKADAVALSFTHGDHYKPLPGYQVMNHHYHMDLGERLLNADNSDTLLPDLQALKALGINIVSQIDSVSMVGMPPTGGPPETSAKPTAAPLGPAPKDNQIEIMASMAKGVRQSSDAGFLVLGDTEVYGSPLGGHTDLLYSHPTYWDQRKPGQPFEENDPKYGKVYHIGSADDMIKMADAENVLISMPHPRTKGSTGFPDAIKDRPYFRDPHYNGFGFRWGMGIDGSETRTCEIRCLPLLDDMSNWEVERGIPLKYAISISEVRHQTPGDDIYSGSPVTYVHLPTLPDNAAPVIETLLKGDEFITTGEVLIPSWSVQGSGSRRTVVADVEWTFPLDFVEVVWGDGKKTGHQIISATDLPPFGSHHFEIPFDAGGKKWVRFAAWDSAYEGAFVEPVLITESKAAAH